MTLGRSSQILMAFWRDENIVLDPNTANWKVAVEHVSVNVPRVNRRGQIKVAESVGRKVSRAALVLASTRMGNQHSGLDRHHHALFQVRALRIRRRKTQVFVVD
jgi:hypothetical protein